GGSGDSVGRRAGEHVYTVYFSLDKSKKPFDCQPRSERRGGRQGGSTGGGPSRPVTVPDRSPSSARGSPPGRDSPRSTAPLFLFLAGLLAAGAPQIPRRHRAVRPPTLADL